MGKPCDEHQIGGSLNTRGGDDLPCAGAIKIIRDRGFGKGSEDDEIELDFDALDTETLWALDDYMMQQTGGKAESPEKANSGFQVEPESDYESEESDLSD